MDLTHVLMLALGLLAGAAIAWALTRARSAAALATAQAEARAHAQQIEQVRADFALRIEQMATDHDRLTDAFDALSAKALAQNSEAFLTVAEQRLARANDSAAAELARREAAVKALVDPLAQTLAQVKREMTDAERARAEAHGALAEQVTAMTTSSSQLRAETSQLLAALSAPHVRGRWGEVHLRRVVEAAGMLRHVDFAEQVTVTSDDGSARPDLVVNLPGEKHIVVDAKVPLTGFMEANTASDSAVRSRGLAAHAKHVRGHVDGLSGKTYWEQFERTPEFVVMFVPADPMLAAALEEDPDLLEYAFTRNIVLATPATLVALLRTVAYTWRQERLAEDAQKVFTTGRELHRRLATLGRHLTDLGKRLNSTVESFNRLNRSVDSNLLPQVKRFSDLQGLADAFELEPPLEVLAVPAEKPDLFPAASDREQQLSSAENR